MPGLERMNPEQPCQGPSAHHPHRYVCDDPDDDCYEEWRPGRYEQFNELACCLDGQTWPCKVKRSHHA